MYKDCKAKSDPAKEVGTHRLPGRLAYDVHIAPGCWEPVEEVELCELGLDRAPERHLRHDDVILRDGELVQPPRRGPPSAIDSSHHLPLAAPGRHPHETVAWPDKGLGAASRTRSRSRPGCPACITPPKASPYRNFPIVASVHGSITAELLVVSERHSTLPSPTGSTATLALSDSALPVTSPTTPLARSTRLAGLVVGQWPNSRRSGRPRSLAAL